MYASSDAESRGCSSGGRYDAHHHDSQSNPTTPTATNAACQLTCDARYAHSGVSIRPTLEPELNRPVQSARSFLGNHWAVVLIAAGKFAASPIASMNRAIANPIAPRTSECP